MLHNVVGKRGERGKRMESYQSIGIVMSIVGILLGIGLNFVLLMANTPNGFLVLLVIGVSFVGIIISLVNVKHHKGVGITMIITGIFGNWLLIIPGIMAYRYKPETKQKFELTK